MKAQLKRASQGKGRWQQQWCRAYLGQLKAQEIKFYDAESHWQLSWPFGQTQTPNAIVAAAATAVVVDCS